MFCRKKKSGNHTYLQIVESRRVNGKPRQRIVASLGRLDTLIQSGALDGIARSAVRLSENILALAEATSRSPATRAKSRSFGAAVVFDRLWKDTGCQQVISQLLTGRRFRFDVERAVFASVLHRLLASGSDRSALKWLPEQKIAGVGEIPLQHLYRAMAWLGEVFPGQDPGLVLPRGVKDQVEERLFARRRDLFGATELVFFDTTSVYFTGRGGKRLGKRGKSKDRRPDCRQMVLGMVLNRRGEPICCEMWPGNTADVTTLEQVATRLEERFGVARVCLVADAGMTSQAVVDAVEQRGWQYILGAGLRKTVEVRDVVLEDPAPFEKVKMTRQRKTPLTLEVKQVEVKGKKEGAKSRRYVVCRNPAQARRDAAAREHIVARLRATLPASGKSLMKNRLYARYVKTGAVELDEEKIEKAAKFDGTWVLRTNTRFTPAEVARRYKQLWMVEQTFRTAKSLLETRPVFHRTDAGIRGHVFCSFLALVLQKELLRRLAEAKVKAGWEDVLRDLTAVRETEIVQDGKQFAVRDEMSALAVKAFRAANLRPPKVIRQIRKPVRAKIEVTAA